VFLERFSPGGRRKGGGCSLRSSLGGPSSFKDLPSSRVLLVIRRHHYHPFSLVKGAGAAAASASSRGMAAIGGGECGGWFGEGRAGGDVDGGGC